MDYVPGNIDLEELRHNTVVKQLDFQNKRPFFHISKNKNKEIVTLK